MDHPKPKPRSASWDASLYESDHAFVWKYGAALIPLLNPQPGERILDLGCGTGQLTSDIAATGAEILGIDSSPDMIGQARQNYPKLKFQLADARSFEVDALLTQSSPMPHCTGFPTRVRLFRLFTAHSSPAADSSPNSAGKGTRGK